MTDVAIRCDDGIALQIFCTFLHSLALFLFYLTRVVSLLLNRTHLTVQGDPAEDSVHVDGPPGEALRG